MLILKHYIRHNVLLNVFHTQKKEKNGFFPSVLFVVLGGNSHENLMAVFDGISTFQICRFQWNFLFPDQMFSMEFGRWFVSIKNVPFFLDGFNRSVAFEGTFLFFRSIVFKGNLGGYKKFPFF